MLFFKTELKCPVPASKIYSFNSVKEDNLYSEIEKVLNGRDLISIGIEFYTLTL